MPASPHLGSVANLVSIVPIPSGEASPPILPVGPLRVGEDDREGPRAGRRRGADAAVDDIGMSVITSISAGETYDALA
jgi:hypothetical protein